MVYEDYGGQNEWRGSTAGSSRRGGGKSMGIPSSEFRRLSNSWGGGSRASNEGDTQTVLLKTFENFYQQESETLITTLEESRDEIKNSMLELCIEQEKCKDELNRMTNGKYSSRKKKDNSLTLSEYLRRKKGLSCSNLPDQKELNINSMAQAETERQAVEKYLRKRDRQKAAELNRRNREGGDNVQAQTERMMDRMKEQDMNKQRERERQMEKVKARLQNRNGASGNGHQPRGDEEVANEILEKYNDQQLAYEREKRAQQQKIQDRINMARERTNAGVPSVDI